MSGPATMVRDAVAGGANTVDAIAATTGLPVDLVRVVTDALRRAGELSVDRVASGCGDGCGDCHSTGSCADSMSGSTSGIALGPTHRSDRA